MERWWDDEDGVEARDLYLMRLRAYFLRREKARNGLV